MRKQQQKKRTQEHNVIGLRVRLCHKTALHSTEYTCTRTCIEYNLPLSPNYSCQYNIHVVLVAINDYECVECL